MSAVLDRTLAILLLRLRPLSNEEVTRCLSASERRRVPLLEVISLRHPGMRSELLRLQEIGRALVRFDQLHACPAGHVQRIGPPSCGKVCARCGGRLERGVLRLPRKVRFSIQVERAIRKRSPVQPPRLAEVAEGTGADPRNDPRLPSPQAVAARSTPPRTSADRSEPPIPVRRRGRPRSESWQVAAIGVVCVAAIALAWSWARGARARCLRDLDLQFDAMAAAGSTDVYRVRRVGLRESLTLAELRWGGDPEVRVRIGRFAWSQGDAGAARTAFAGALGASPPPREAVLGQGMVSAWLWGRREGAEGRSELATAWRSFDGLAARGPESREGRVAAVALDFMGGGAGSGCRPGVGSTDGAEREGECVQLRAWDLLRRGRFSDALAFARADPRRRFDPYLRIVQPLAHLGLGDAKAAREAADSMLELWPEMIDARLVGATARIADGKVADSLPFLDRVLAEEPDLGIALRLRARALTRAERFAEALADVDAALRIEEVGGDLRFLRGELLLRLGRPDEGRRDLREYLDRCPVGSRVAAARSLLHSGLPAASSRVRGGSAPTRWRDEDADGTPDPVLLAELREVWIPALGWESDAGGAGIGAEVAAGDLPTHALNPFRGGVANPPAATAPAVFLPETGVATAPGPRWAPMRRFGHVPEQRRSLPQVLEVVDAWVRRGPPDRRQAAGRFPFPLDREALVHAEEAAFRAYRLPLGKEEDLACTLEIAAGWSPVPVAVEARTARDGLLCMGGFRSPALRFGVAEVVVFATRLPFEVSAVDWLAWFVREQGLQWVAGRIGVGRGGAAADWLVRDPGGDRSRLLRLGAFKDGWMLYLVSASAPEGDYAGLAQSLAIPILSWSKPEWVGPVEAEVMQVWHAERGVRRSLAFPESWSMSPPDSAEPQADGIDLTWSGRAPGRAAMAIRVWNRKRYEDLAEEALAARARSAVLRRYSPGPVRHGSKSTETAGAGSARGFLEVARVEGGRGPCEVRTLLLRDEEAVIVVCGVGPDRVGDYETWAITRRAMECVLASLGR